MTSSLPSTSSGSAPQARQPPVAEIGVFVLGPNRSGTSALTRSVNLLGVPVSGGADSVGADHNPRGLWEVPALTLVNEGILTAFGGTWSCPPLMPGEWVRDERALSQRGAAAERFREYHAAGPWVWKDPRNCITLPFWLDLLDVRPAVILAHRHPDEVWKSLAARDGIGKHLAFALWERYLRSAVEASRGLPTLVVRYADLLADPSGWARETTSFLKSVGIDSLDEYAGLDAFLDSSLRHTVVEEQDSFSDPDASSSQRELFAMVEGLTGAHERLESVKLPPETPFSEDIFAERRRAELEHQQLILGTLRAHEAAKESWRQLEAWEQSVAAREQSVATREQQVSAKEQHVGALQQQQTAMQGALDATREYIADIEMSRSWRLTAPLRRLGSLARRAVYDMRLLKARIPGLGADFRPLRAELAAMYLSGTGIEVGALHEPLPLPDDAAVRYVDRLSVEELRTHYPELDGHPLISPDLIEDAETLPSVADESLDFVVANHFIEHCEDPIGTIENHLRVLKPGGVLYLAVPDKRFTFDWERPSTSLDHMLRDHREGPDWSRMSHFEEWARFKERVRDRDVSTKAAKLADQRYSIHFHVWTSEEFRGFLDRCRNDLGMAFRVEESAFNHFETIFILRKQSQAAAMSEGRSL